MRFPKYALGPLLRIRDRHVDLSVGELARAAHAREDAKRTSAAANVALALHQQATHEVRAREQEALARGELRAGDLATGEAWSLRAQGEERVLQADVVAARSSEAQALASEREAQARLAARKVDAEIVHKHRSRFDERRRKGAEAHDEEAAFEAWRPKR